MGPKSDVKKKISIFDRIINGDSIFGDSVLHNNIFQSREN